MDDKNVNQARIRDTEAPVKRLNIIMYLVSSEDPGQARGKYRQWIIMSARPGTRILDTGPCVSAVSLSPRSVEQESSRS